MMIFSISVLAICNIYLLFAIFKLQNECFFLQVDINATYRRLSERFDMTHSDFEKRLQNEWKGLISQARIKNKVSETLADRAFNMASSANLAIMSLQRTLAVRPAYVPKQKKVENEAIQKEVMKTVGGTPDYSGFDWMYPILEPEEQDLIDKAMEHAAKYTNNTEIKD